MRRSPLQSPRSQSEENCKSASWLLVISNQICLFFPPSGWPGFILLSSFSSISARALNCESTERSAGTSHTFFVALCNLQWGKTSSRLLSKAMPPSNHLFHDNIHTRDLRCLCHDVLPSSSLPWFLGYWQRNQLIVSMHAVHENPFPRSGMNWKTDIYPPCVAAPHSSKRATVDQQFIQATCLQHVPAWRPNKAHCWRVI